MDKNNIEVGSLVRIEGLNFRASVVAINWKSADVQCCYYSKKTEAFEILTVSKRYLQVESSPSMSNPQPGDMFRVVGYDGGVMAYSFPRDSEKDELHGHDVKEVVCLYDAGGKWVYGYVPVPALIAVEKSDPIPFIVYG